MGWRVPVSLFADMMDTSVVSGVIASASLLRSHAPARIDRQPRHAEAFLFLQVLAGVQHRVMLRGAGDHVLSARGVRPREADDREVVRLGAAAGEDDLVRLRAEQPRQPVARIIDRRPRLAPRRMDARGIAKVPLEKRPHRRERLGRERSGGVVVEIDHITQSPTHSSGRLSLSKMRSWFSS